MLGWIHYIVGLDSLHSSEMHIMTTGMKRSVSDMNARLNQAVVSLFHQRVFLISTSNSELENI